MSPPGFGGAPYSSPQERTLTSITDGREQTPKSAEEISRMLQTQQAQIRFLASNQKQMQKGINEATQNPIQQMQQFISDLIVLFGGGQLAQGVLDFGDLTYILPALGALFGFGDGPFPLNLIAAAEKFFFGYVVPTQAFTDLLNHFIGTWLEAFGIDEKFVADVKDLVTAVGELFDGVTGLLPNVNEFFGALGITAAGLGPLGLALAPIIKLFEAIDIKKFGNAVEFITDAIDPWIVQLTQIINFTNAVLHILGSGEDVLNSPLPQLTAPWANLIKFLGGINFAIANFNPLAAAQQFIGRLLIPLGGISEVQPDLQLDSSFDESSSIAEDSPAWAPQDLDPLVDYPEGWLWDLVGRNAPGSATVDCDGANHALLGTEIPVVEGQTFAPECWLTWSGVTATGSTFRLQVMTDGGSATDIAAVSSPAASAGWTHLSGTYTVPAGVATIRTRLYVSGNATAGQVWFDDAPIRRTNLMQKGFIQGLVDDLTELFGNFAAMIDGILGTGHTFSDLVTFIASGLSLAAEAADNFTALLSGLSLANITSLVSFLDTASSNAVDAIGALGDLVANALQVDAAGVGTLIASLLTMLTQISDIFNGSVVTPVNTVVQQIKDWWAATGENIPNAISDVGTIISSAGQTLASAVGTAIQNAGAALDDVKNNVIGGATNAVTVWGQAWEGAFAGFFNSISGASVAAAQTGQVSSAMTSQRETIVGISTAVAQLQAAAAASGSSGVFGGDDFEREDLDDLGSDWAVTYSGGDSSDGYVAIANGHQAAWETGDAVTRSVFCRRTASADQHTQTNYQKIRWTVGAIPDVPSNGGDPVYTRLYFRVSDDESSYSFVEIRNENNGFGGDNTWVQFGYKNGGPETYVGSPILTSYISGFNFTLYAGNPDTFERYYELIRLGSSVATWDDTSTEYSAVGASNLGWGFGLQAAAAPGGVAQAAPASLDSITIADNGPGAFDYASLPDFGNPGRRYPCQDIGLELLDTGSEWLRINGGPRGWFTPPPDTGWSPVNAGSTTFSASKDGLLFISPSDPSGSYHLQVRTLSPASNYTAEFYVEMTAMDAAGSDAWVMGIILRESSSQKFVTLEQVVSSNAFGSGALIRAAKWTNTTTLSAAYKARYVQFLSGAFPNWIRFRDNGTTRYFEYSHNGVEWLTFYSVGRTDFCTPDQIGVGVFNVVTGFTNHLRIRSLEGVS
ncbi:hypothetical protein DAVIS_02681 [Mycobacterium marinum]|uniref:DUF7257 domain-containing protein n=1 Tax=Mycobacterium marinum TaxID=1781 RepID=A0A3E2MW93_MYCMR|nr:hypothetical protein [Mycobacterium marinum]RFZ41412.1 hypothetical protein DAVIS_02681 [Mycobacterium marinum]